MVEESGAIFFWDGMVPLRLKEGIGYTTKTESMPIFFSWGETSTDTVTVLFVFSLSNHDPPRVPINFTWLLYTHVAAGQWAFVLSYRLSSVTQPDEIWPYTESPINLHFESDGIMWFCKLQMWSTILRTKYVNPTNILGQ